MDIRDIRKRRVYYDKEFKVLEEQLINSSLSDDDFSILENKQDVLYKKILFCDLIIDSYNASDEEDCEKLLQILDKGSDL